MFTWDLKPNLTAITNASMVRFSFSFFASVFNSLQRRAMGRYNCIKNGSILYLSTCNLLSTPCTCLRVIRYQTRVPVYVYSTINPLYLSTCIHYQSLVPVYMKYIINPLYLSTCNPSSTLCTCLRVSIINSVYLSTINP